MPYKYKYRGELVMKYHAYQLAKDNSTLEAVPGGVYSLKTKVRQHDEKDFELLDQSHAPKEHQPRPAEEPVKTVHVEPVKEKEESA